MVMKLSEAAAALGIEMESNIQITGVCTDSRQIKSGCLFAAIDGEHFDGHDYVNAAASMGAVAALCSHTVDRPSIPVLPVKNTVDALLRLARYYRSKFNIPVVGITGSVGKTTTKELVASVLLQRYRTVRTQGNFNNEIGLPLTIFTIHEDTQAAALEMGMRGFGEISILSKVAQPSVGIITKIGVSHMEALGSQEGILRAKLELLDGMKAGTPLIVNGDDPYLANIENDSHPVIRCGIENKNCEYRAAHIHKNMNGTSFDIFYGNNKQSVFLPAVGLHNVLNAVCAFAAGVIIGIDGEAAAKGLANYEPSGMRQRVVQCGGITVIEDCYNASPDSVEASLSALVDLAGDRRKIAVLGDMLELGGIAVSSHRSCGEMAAQKADILFTAGPLSAHYIEGAVAKGMRHCRHFSDNEALSKALIDEIKDGDTVLFKASRGMKMEEAIEPVYERWKDR